LWEVAEPLTTGLLMNLARAAIERLGSSALRMWTSTDDMGRVFLLLEAAVSHQLPAVVASELEDTWRKDAAFVEAFAELSNTANAAVALPALAHAIEPHVGPTAQNSEAEVANYLARPSSRYCGLKELASSTDTHSTRHHVGLSYTWSRHEGT
jgi:hypothetical protein